MFSFLSNKHSGLVLRFAIVGGSLAVLLLGWQLGGGGHAAATAPAAALTEPLQQKQNEAGHAPPSWTAAAVPLENGSPTAAPLAQVTRPMPTQERSKPAADPRKDAVAAITEDQIIPVDPAQPANWMLTGGQYISVQGYVPATGGRGVALDVVLTPAVAAAGGVMTATVGNSAGSTAAAGSSAATQSVSQTTSAATTTTNADASAAAPDARLGTGFTYEEELFRSKWGWAAYGAAQRAAQWQN